MRAIYCNYQTPLDFMLCQQYEKTRGTKAVFGHCPKCLFLVILSHFRGLFFSVHDPGRQSGQSKNCVLMGRTCYSKKCQLSSFNQCLTCPSHALITNFLEPGTLCGALRMPTIKGTILSRGVGVGVGKAEKLGRKGNWYRKHLCSRQILRPTFSHKTRMRSQVEG